ncbi:MAG: YdcF family protein [bacterium]|nr:YdcF family protein [bacterium]
MIPTVAHLRLLQFLVITTCITILFIILSTIFYVWTEFDGNSNFPVECALVFGASVHSNDQPGPGIKRRVATAAELYNDGSVSRIIVTGGKGDAFKDSEARVMQREAMRRGVDPEDIFLEETAVSTWQNISHTVDLRKGCDGVVAVSDRYHLARIRQLVAKQGEVLDIYTYPAGDHPNVFFEFKSVLREAFGIIYYTVGDYTSLDIFAEK